MKLAPAGNKRWRHHLVLGLGALLGVLLASLVGAGDSLADQLSFATAYVCLLYLAIALAIGPLQLQRGGDVLLNNYRRRDVGIWAGITGLVHFVVATDLSMSQVYLADYVAIDAAGFSADVRMQFFTWGTIAGLVIAVLLVLLLALSNDRVLRRLGRRWWKRLQRSAYLAFALTVAHGLAFQLLESRSPGLIALLLVFAAAVAWVQLAGVISFRRGARRD